MRFSDYALLAFTKIRTRKIRSLLTLIAASILVVFLLMGSFTYTGTRQSIENAAPPALEGKHIAIEDAFTNGFGEVPSTGGPFDAPPGDYASYDDYLAKIEPFNPTAKHTHINIAGNFWASNDRSESCAYDTSFDSPGQERVLEKNTCVSAASRSSQFFDYFAEEGFKTTQYTGEAIPIVITNSYARGLSAQQFDRNDTPEEKIAKTAKARDEVLGDQFEVAYLDFDTAFTLNEESLLQGDTPPEPIKRSISVKVVGLTPDVSIIKELAGVSSYAADNASIIFPESRVPEDLKQQAEQQQPGRIHRLTEFATLGELDKYTAAGCQGDECWNGSSGKVEHSYYTDYGRAIEVTFKQAWSFTRWLILIWGIGVGISIMSTTAKVIVDSRKEIGVFRAIGARRHQIFGIYAAYVTMLALIAFVLSFIVARIITAIMDAKWSDDISVQIALLNGSSSPRGHYSFFGIDILHILAILAFIIVVALVGSAIPVMRNLRKDPLRYLRDD